MAPSRTCDKSEQGLDFIVHFMIHLVTLGGFLIHPGCQESFHSKHIFPGLIKCYKIWRRCNFFKDGPRQMTGLSFIVAKFDIVAGRMKDEMKSVVI